MTSADAHPWDRQPGEPAIWHSRFLAYRALGRTRTVADAWRGEKGRKGVKPPGHWYDVSREWSWQERAKAWDDAQFAEEGQLVAERRRQASRAAFAKLVEAIPHLDPKRITWHSFAAFMAALFEQQRVEYGQEPATKLEVSGKIGFDELVRKTAEREGLDPAEVLAEVERILAIEEGR